MLRKEKIDFYQMLIKNRQQKKIKTKQKKNKKKTKKGEK